MERIPDGTVVEKINSKSGDTHSDGARARVVSVVPVGGDVFGYFVEWDDMPGLSVFVSGHRIRPVEGEPWQAN